MRKVIIVFLLIILFLHISCSKKPVNITYWSYNTGPYVEAATELVDQFNKSQRAIIVNLEYFSFESSGDHDKMVKNALEENKAADAIQYYGSTRLFAKESKILAVPVNVFTKEEIETNFFKSALGNRLYDGRYYGLPAELNIESPGLIVNTKIFKEMRIAIPSAWYTNYGPTTWEEMYDIAKKLTIIKDGNIIQSGLGVVNRQESSMFLSLIWQMGGNYLDYEKKRINFNTPEAKKALLFIKNLITGPDRIHSTKVKGGFEGYKAGQNAMTISAPWYGPEFRNLDFKSEYFNLPPFINGSKPYFVGEGGWGYIVNSQTRYPKEAWQFVSFLMREENINFWAVKVGAIPALKKSVESIDFVNNEIAKNFIYPALKILDYGVDPGSQLTDTSGLIWIIVRRNLRAYLKDILSSEEALTNMTKEANESLMLN